MCHFGKKKTNLKSTIWSSLELCSCHCKGVAKKLHCFRQEWNPTPPGLFWGTIYTKVPNLSKTKNTEMNHLDLARIDIVFDWRRIQHPGGYFEAFSIFTSGGAPFCLLLEAAKRNLDFGTGWSKCKYKRGSGDNSGGSIRQNVAVC